MALPGGRRSDQRAVVPLFLPVAHLTDVDTFTVARRTDPLTLTACAPVHAGGDRQALQGEVVLSVEHLSLFVGIDAPLNMLNRLAAQPECGVDDVQVVIEQGKAEILRPDAIAAVLFNPQGSDVSHLRPQLLIARGEAAIKGDHQLTLLFLRQRHQRLCLIQGFRQRLIDADIFSGQQQRLHHLIVRGGAAVDKNGIAGRGQRIQGTETVHTVTVAEWPGFGLIRRKCPHQRPVRRRRQNRQPGFLCDTAESHHTNT